LVLIDFARSVELPNKEKPYNILPEPPGNILPEPPGNILLEPPGNILPEAMEYVHVTADIYAYGQILNQFKRQVKVKIDPENDLIDICTNYQLIRKFVEDCVKNRKRPFAAIEEIYFNSNKDLFNDINPLAK